MHAREIRVAAEGPGDFARIDEALAFARGLPPGPLVLRVAPGTYREKLRVTRPDLRIIGAGREATRIVFGDSALRRLPDGEAMGTFNSYTVYVGAPGASIAGLTIENDAGDGRIVGQAVALYADADRLLFEDCAFLGRQDTICTGPLPKDPPPKGINLVHPVAGLGDDEPALPFRQVYRRCRVAGDVDFIFGSAAALYEDCELRSLPRGEDDGFIAAPSTYPGQAAGFVFDRCRLTFPGDRPARGRAFLGRPWRPRGRAVYLRCEMGAGLEPAGWDDWGKPEARELGHLGELGSTGPGARPGERVPWAGRPSEAEVEAMIRVIAPR